MRDLCIFLGKRMIFTTPINFLPEKVSKFRESIIFCCNFLYTNVFGLVIENLNLSLSITHRKGKL